MEPAEIDDLLQRYTSAEARIASNLVELDDHPTYALLAADTLTGRTAQRLGPAVDAVPRMWLLLDALRRHLELARTTRGEGRVNSAARTQLVHLLSGPSVLVEVVSTPLEERDVVGSRSAERRNTVDEVIDEIRALYTPVRDGIAEIDQIWRDILPRLDAAEATLGALEAELDEIGGDEPLVKEARRRVEELRATIMDDPLGVDAGAGPELDDLLRRAAHHVGRLRTSHDELAADLARTEELVATIRTLRARAASAHAEATAKIAPPLELGRAPSVAFVEELAEQAAELRRSTGPWQHTRQWLHQWLVRAERLVEQLTRVEERNRRPLERRSQLRGLLSAYRAKAAAVGRIEQRATIELADEAHNELYTSPTDLQRAETLVARLAQAVSEPDAEDAEETP